MGGWHSGKPSIAQRMAGSRPHDCCSLLAGQCPRAPSLQHGRTHSSPPTTSALEGTDPAPPAPLPSTALQLRAALQEPDGSVPGFMKVCDCLVSTSSSGKEAGFSGMIIGELHGEWIAAWPVLVCLLCALGGWQRAWWRAVRRGVGTWVGGWVSASLSPSLSPVSPTCYPCLPPN
jgi:hypothetical protein